MGGNKKKSRQAERHVKLKESREEKSSLAAVAATDRLNRRQKPIDLTSPEKASSPKAAVVPAPRPADDTEPAALKDDVVDLATSPPKAILPAPRPADEPVALKDDGAYNSPPPKASAGFKDDALVLHEGPPPYSPGAPPTRSDPTAPTLRLRCQCQVDADVST